MKTGLTLLLLAVTLHLSGKQAGTMKGTDEDDMELPSDDFSVTIRDKPLFVYKARVSRFPINQVWPGYQRPKSQTELASFITFDMDGITYLKVRSSKKIETVEIRPKIFQIEYRVNGDEIEIKLYRPLQFVVEVNGYHNALHVFANKDEKAVVDRKDPKLKYYGPGIHNAGTIELKSNETLYIAEGAVVYGTVRSENSRNIKIKGKGILDASKVRRGDVQKMIFLRYVTNALIEGIILRDSHDHAVFPVNCDSIVIDNIKLIGFWRYNSDGIDPVSSRNVTIRNCFIRSFDDNIAVKGVKWSYEKAYSIVENIHVDNCVLWNDWGKPLEIGAGTVADTLRNISFTNCYIPRFTFAAMSIRNDNRGYITNVLYKNIYIEEPILDSARNEQTGPIDRGSGGKSISMIIGKSMYSTDSTRGNIRNVRFENIRYNSSEGEGKISLKGYSEIHCIKNLFFRDFFLHNKKLEENEFDSLIYKNDFVDNIKLE